MRESSGGGRLKGCFADRHGACEVEAGPSEGGGLPWLYSEFGASLGYMRP